MSVKVLNTRSPLPLLGHPYCHCIINIIINHGTYAFIRDAFLQLESEGYLVDNELSYYMNFAKSHTRGELLGLHKSGGEWCENTAIISN